MTNSEARMGQPRYTDCRTLPAVGVSGLISLEAAVFWAGVLGLEVAQVAHAVPAQTAIQS
ncbi:MAG: hypothetical protein ACI853_000416 [Paracoccaceae bacterium]